eukprot:472477-Prymnesium_polylepis.1
MPPRVRAVIGGAGALPSRVRPAFCVWARRCIGTIGAMGWTWAGRAVRGCGASGGSNAPAYDDAGWWGGLQAGPSGTATRTPACGARGDVRFYLLLFARLCAPSEKKVQHFSNARAGAMLRKSVQWTRDCACMGRYIIVLRLNRPESATFYGFTWGLKPWPEPLVKGADSMVYRYHTQR